ncbi:methyltransferase domain-containing protein [Colletotrichum graminicola]|uniref:Methyltransferase domain-containing protein n=1 Tax=Colletotrichum graminicola (strain M1.001 / M2 / FGSC 10212) TaxID=645133 RepID=E3R0Q9_COLGM|nr:methyltransferase domain-containing protein [Colletotrichum graminicola M1.001]EFQ36697.1 methyltransferase domain-containing protein [Colletotrichum graminicola M1.001]WDK14855.1 methyltransferase domain-containing protein [Colletotrichum graminicola]
MPFILRFLYDGLVIRLYCKYAWGCSKEDLSEFYNACVASANKTAILGQHTPSFLDIGVGTGYFLEHAPFSAGSHVTLADLNTDCLLTASRRVIGTHPTLSVRTLVVDVLESDERSSLALTSARLAPPHAVEPKPGFDLISCLCLIHCLPGPTRSKTEAIISLGKHLRPEGVIVGATVLGKGVRHNWLGAFLLLWHNILGIFSNRHDDIENIVKSLEAAFDSVEWSVVGRMLLFEASNPKR